MPFSSGAATAAAHMASAEAKRTALEEDLKRMLMTPTVVAGTRASGDHKKLYARVQKLEGYMEILLDTLEKQDEQIKALTDRVTGLHRDLGRAML